MKKTGFQGVQAARPASARQDDEEIMTVNFPTFWKFCSVGGAIIRRECNFMLNLNPLT